jgi:chromosome partitioning protein
MKIAIVNQKGGSGKSTTAVLLAKAYAEAGKAVLIIDCDPQGGASELFGCARKPGLFDVLTKQSKAADAIHKSDIAGLEIMPADFRLDQIFVSANPFALANVCKELSQPIIVFDTPPTMQGLTRAAIMAADRVLIPCEMSETAFSPTVYTVEQVKQLNKKPEVMIAGYKSPSELSGTRKELSQRYTEALREYYAGTIPRSLTAAKMATPKGKWTQATRATIEQPLLSWGGA